MGGVHGDTISYLMYTSLKQSALPFLLSTPRADGTLNQDSFLACRLHPEKEHWLLAAFDGHGLLVRCISWR